MQLSISHRILVFWTLMIATFAASMTMISISIMLPPIMTAFNIPTSTAQWLTSGGSLVSGIMIPVAAFLIKRFPNRIYFIFSMAMFAIGSFLAFIANEFTVLFTGRIIQALGGGLLMPFSQIILLSIYPRERHGTVMGYFTLGALIAPVISPYIAGLVIDNLGWQFMFNILLYISLGAMLLGMIFMKNVTQRYPGSLSTLSVIFSSVGFSGLLIGFGNLSNSHVLNLHTGGALLGGIIFLILFVMLQFRLKNPLLDLRIFRYPMFRKAVFIAITMYMAFMGGANLLPIYGQSLMGFSATFYALIILPGSILMALVSVISGRFYDKYGPRIVLMCGALLLLLGNIMGLLFTMETNPIYIGIVSFLPAAGIAIIMPPIAPMALGELNEKGRVDGSALLGTIRLIVNAIAVTYAILLYTIFSEMYEPIAGIRASYISSSAFSIILLVYTVSSLKNHGRKSA